MNNIEEILWNYIDGNCTPDEARNIARLIENEGTYRLKYQELTTLDKEFTAMELDEPPMAFTYNVIEAIRSEQAQVPMKAAINKRIIMGIAAFFIITLTAFIIYMLGSMDWSAGMTVADNIPAGFNLPEVNTHISKPIVEGFMFLDVVLGLFLFDTWLRRKNAARHR